MGLCRPGEDEKGAIVIRTIFGEIAADEGVGSGYV
jgi:hypothetical protein